LSLTSDRGFIQNVLHRVRDELGPSFSGAAFINGTFQILRELSEEDLVSMQEEQDSLCHRCGACCTVSRYVRMTEEEFEAIAAYLGLSSPELSRDTDASREESYYLVSGNPCPFYDAPDRGCRVYEMRPRVCRLFPMGFSLKQMGEGKPPFFTGCPATEDLLVGFIVRRLRE
jgi:Fe-S-cluster containining protein